MKTGIKPLKECNVLVTPTSFSKYNKNLANELESSVGKVIYNTTGKPLSEGDLIPLINDIDGFIAGLDNITSNVMKAARNLKIIARYGAGVDRVDLNAAKEYGIYVTNTPGTNSVSVAELTIGLAIAAARNIIEGSSDTKNGNWPRISGATLADKTFGIIGLGSIGKEVAKRLKTFNVKLVTYDVFFDESFLIQYDIRKTDLKELLTISDFISLHIPVTKETINIINKESLARMKKGSILINTARGELIDENALYESLASGHLKAAAIDTFKKEPPDKENKLLSLSQIITTPHMGAATDNASNDMTRISIEECLAVLKGEKPKYIVTGP